MKAVPHKHSMRLFAMFRRPCRGEIARVGILSELFKLQKADNTGLVNDSGRLLPRLARTDFVWFDVQRHFRHRSPGRWRVCPQSTFSNATTTPKMRRTYDIPLPSGRMSPEAALIIGGVCAGTGLIWLALAVNLLTALLGAITLASYLCLHTAQAGDHLGLRPSAPFPARFPLSWVGPPPGVKSRLAKGVSLFAILFFWQLPHFLAIAWVVSG